MKKKIKTRNKVYVIFIANILWHIYSILFFWKKRWLCHCQWLATIIGPLLAAKIHAKKILADRTLPFLRINFNIQVFHFSTLVHFLQGEKSFHKICTDCIWYFLLFRKMYKNLFKSAKIEKESYLFLIK